MFPYTRYRRLRGSPTIRALVAETAVSPAELIAPMFVVEGKGIKREIKSLPGQFQFSPDRLIEETGNLREVGVKAVLLFGLPLQKDENGDVACDDNGIVQRAVRELKRAFPDVVVAADVCFCEYTTHGHCGILVDADVDNDLTLGQTAKQALSLARAGVDIVAPSGMMDGAVLAIREALDGGDFAGTLIMSYSAKYASSFYGPFREAANSAPAFGDRRTYQMDPANRDEAMREIQADIEEGADIIMVKPAMPYLDIIRAASELFPVPLAAYQVSGEYAMIKAAAERGLIDGQRAMLETITSIKRAGAKIIITYFAKEAAPLL